MCIRLSQTLKNVFRKITLMTLELNLSYNN